MPLPLYRGLQAPQSPDLATMHMGLWFERYFSGYAEDFSEVDQPKRSEWLREFKSKLFGQRTDLDAKKSKRELLAASQGGQTRIYHCEGSFVTGLGNAHPIENGFLWHPTLGMPYLPASAVKGLMRALVETAYPGDDKGAILKRWFGTEAKGDVADNCGHFIFLDALPVASCELVPEVMTPHMGKWYEAGGKNPLSSSAQPGDWHSPVPVSYLTARNLRLQFVILPRAGTTAPAELQQELANLWLTLDKALEWLGAGAKTAIGFGLMRSEEGKLREQQQRLDESAEPWPGAQVTFSRSNGSLTAKKGGQSAVALAPKGEELLSSLPDALQKKIRANQFAKATAYVAEGTILKIAPD